MRIERDISTYDFHPSRGIFFEKGLPWWRIGFLKFKCPMFSGSGPHSQSHTVLVEQIYSLSQDERVNDRIFSYFSSIAAVYRQLQTHFL